MSNTPLGVLDLVPVSSGATAAQALRNSIDLVRQTERFGYRRFWFAEHHLNEGTASVSPAVLIALAADKTSTIRLGSGAVLMGHRTALATVEEFGLLDALHPGRIDIGLGNTGDRATPRSLAPAGPAGIPGSIGTGVDVDRVVRGLRVPPIAGMAEFLANVLRSPLFALTNQLLYAPGATPPDYEEQVGDILDMVAGRFSRNGLTPPIVPGAGASSEVWVMGSTAGKSARVAGKYGLPLAVGYHVSPGTALDAIEAYRTAFRPSDRLAEPYVSVCVDVVVGPDESTARRLAGGYGAWVHSIRTARGAMPFPTPEEAAAYQWDDEGLRLIADRISTQVVGDPAAVADQLEVVRAATDADELVITTITHDHTDRVRSYQLLAREWHRRADRGAHAGRSQRQM